LNTIKQDFSSESLVAEGSKLWGSLGSNSRLFPTMLKLSSDHYINHILRKQLVTAMLEVIDYYPFCSIASQQAILVLDFLKKAMGEDELELLKKFVQTNLSDEDTVLIRYAAGRTTTRANLAPLIQIGLALKKMIAQPEEADQQDTSLQEEEKG